MDILSVLGDAANELEKTMLLEIVRKVRACNKNHENELEHGMSYET